MNKEIYIQVSSPLIRGRNLVVGVGQLKPLYFFHRKFSLLSKQFRYSRYHSDEKKKTMDIFKGTSYLKPSLEFSQFLFNFLSWLIYKLISQSILSPKNNGKSSHVLFNRDMLLNFCVNVL